MEYVVRFNTDKGSIRSYLNATDHNDAKGKARIEFIKKFGDELLKKVQTIDVFEIPKP